MDASAQPMSVPATASEEVQVQRALLSVSDKTGIVEFARGLTELGIGNAVYYPTPIHRLKPYLGEDGKPGPWELPETERAAAEVISLPVHPSLTQADLERIAEGANLAGGAR